MEKSFNERVYAKVRKIPRGRVSTYRAVAHALKSKAYRAVGNAMNKNPYSYVRPAKSGGHSSAKEQKSLVPCHRVVGSDGSMTGFASGIKNKIKMLRAEGVEIVNGKVDLSIYGHKI